MSRICVNESLEINWLNVHDRYLEFIVSDIFKFSISAQTTSMKFSALLVIME